MVGTAGSDTASEQLRKLQQTREFQGLTLLILGAAVGLSTGMTATMFYSLGAFIPSLQAQFGWARGDISLAVTIMTIGLFLSGPLVGRLCDHFGAATVDSISLDRKSTRLNPVTNAHLVCRLLLETKNTKKNTTTHI